MHTEAEVEKVVSSLRLDKDLSKDSQVTVRIESGLYEALKAQTEIFGYENISQTVRTILGFYFLPVAYEFELKHKMESDLKLYLEAQQQGKFYIEVAWVSQFGTQLAEYLMFLKQAKSKSKHSIEFLEQTEKKLNGIVAEIQEKIGMALKEIAEDKKDE